MSDEQCGNCRFWLTRFNGCYQGTCRRHAPVLDIGQVRCDSREPRSRWPETMREWWCGDYQAGKPKFENE